MQETKISNFTIFHKLKPVRFCSPNYEKTVYSWLDVSVLRKEILCIKKLRTQRNPSAIAQSVHSILEQSGLVEDLAADCAWNKVRKGPSPCIK